MQKPAKLKNRIMPYAWGSTTAIQDLLGCAPDHEDTPWAELWMGAHAKAPSAVEWRGDWVNLDRLVQQYPVEILGEAAARRFSNTFPYLFKVLAAEKPLSIQAHPDRDRAQFGFMHENAIGVPLDAPERNYKDDRHKPECLCALQPFTALNGFRPVEEILDGINRVCPGGLKTEIDALARHPDANGIKTFFGALMTLSDDRKTKIINEVAANAANLPTESNRWIRILLHHYPDDIGILSPLLLNLVHLLPGQAMFLPAGRLHAYLEGVGIELMANSDNVLRGGLTPKHIDVPELLKTLAFDPVSVEILRPVPVRACEKQYPTDVSEFSLSEIRITPEITYRAPSERGAEILLCITGTAHIHYNDNCDPLSFTKGESVLIPADVRFYRIEGEARIFKAAIPIQFADAHDDDR